MFACSLAFLICRSHRFSKGVWIFFSSVDEYRNTCILNLSLQTLGAFLYAVNAVRSSPSDDDFLKASNSSLLAFGAKTLHTARQAWSTFSWHSSFLFFVASSQFDVSLKVSGSTSLKSDHDRDVICDIASLYTFMGSTSDSSSDGSDSSSCHSPGVHGDLLTLSLQVALESLVTTLSLRREHPLCISWWYYEKKA